MLIFFFSLILLYLIGFGACYTTSLDLKANGYAGLTCVECLNPVKWFSVAVGFILKWIIPEHILEQYVLRLYDEECREKCYKSEEGTCYQCGCDAMAKALSPLESCSNGNWGPIILNKETYEKTRVMYPVKIEIKYGKAI